ncbi:predicted protein [Histoplasma mississippiense (nom. inval.)]|uniref:predicted protein n=1 Tax=Ajellomyces capsulatus (strain NAm1 / WU24) TaxID=2059318 RepID=UPI000157B9BA|nr:predicted protein [Histoplasma mississippiense (nom. inval.)]EDN03373.1 predicted protein [Histoplasma mississippiense (nom. inval.)]
MEETERSRAGTQHISISEYIHFSPSQIGDLLFFQVHSPGKNMFEDPLHAAKALSVLCFDQHRYDFLLVSHA